jgi:YjjG family noncanonical pyrimidine nucleotidase
MPLQWILFDLDNTLLDFDAGAGHALNATLQDYGFENSRELTASYHQINHRCWQKFEEGEIDIPTLKKLRFTIFVEENDLKVNPDTMNRHYLDLLSRQIEEITGARQLLDQTSQKFKLALVTNGFAEVQRPRIHHSGLQRYFEHIVISEEIGANKPATAFFDHTFSLLGQPDPQEVMIIGDSLSSDIKGGSDYGIKTCWFNPKKLENQGTLRPDHTVSSLHHISGIWR